MLNTIFTSHLIAPNTWVIHGEGCTSYLLVGEDCSLMIDTGFSTENIKAYVENLVDKKVEMVVNTHGHFDHTGGNGYFPYIYMHENAIYSAKMPYPSLDASKYKTDYPVITVGDGYCFNLGNREIEVIEIPGHSPGDIALLDKKERILFTGDEVDNRIALIWMQDEPQPTIEQHYKNMKKLMNRKSEFDYVCSGHNSIMVNGTIVKDFLELDRKIMDGEKGSPVILTEDLPKDFYMPQMEYKRSFTYNGVEVMYDIRYVFENKIQSGL